MKYCIECGTKNNSAAKFCSNCGHSFGKVEKKKAEASFVEEVEDSFDEFNFEIELEGPVQGAIKGSDIVASAEPYKRKGNRKSTQKQSVQDILRETSSREVKSFGNE